MDKKILIHYIIKVQFSLKKNNKTMESFNKQYDNLIYDNKILYEILF